MIIVMQTSADLRRSDQAACRVAPSVIDSADGQMWGSVRLKFRLVKEFLLEI